tara:strand:+ start:5390 stop:5518 length:129 start_codon:yes stop_codon:yes gene_type:complete
VWLEVAACAAAVALVLGAVAAVAVVADRFEVNLFGVDDGSGW